ncbi:hypothetical protein [Halospeciosus flavus]|uniref:DUF7847 domain-containing protein n=1 Tax=Halospeciosus flavus TaxID=3032283 RepID=A0ABD5Z6I0_9EURY|nr:hypothetical protein [Halospeciosus flavus]
MAVVSALQDAVDTLKRNPILFVAATLYGLVQVPAWLLQISGSPALQLVSSAYNLLLVFVFPFFMGGLLSMALDGLTGSTSLSRFWSGGKQYYLRLLAVSLLFFVVYFIVGFGVAFLVFALVLGGVIGGGAGFGGVSLAVLAVIGIVGLLFALVILVVGFLFQFYAQAIVVDDEGVIDSLKRSYSVVRQNLVTVIGFDVLAFVLGALISSIPIGYLFFTGAAFNQMSTAPLGVRLGFVLLSILITIIIGAIGVTFTIAFYVRITASREGSGTAQL